MTIRKFLLSALIATLFLVSPCGAVFENMWIVMYECNPAGLPGRRVYRVYCRFTNPDDRLLTVFGNASNPATISGGPFYQNLFGTNTAPDAASIANDPRVLWDTFVTIGVGLDNGNDQTQVTPGFPTLPVTNNTNMGWYVLPQNDEQGAPDLDGMVLIGQFTTSGGAPLVTANIIYRPAGSSTTVTVNHVSWVLLPLTAGDVNHDLSVNINDLVLIINNWGNTGPGIPDPNDDGVVNIDDLVLVITHWGLFTGSCS